MESLDRWLDREYRYAATAMLRSVSAVETVKARPGFGQSVRAATGSIIASPVPGAYDPDPDYFFHWYRDSAIVIDALRLLYEDGLVGADALTHLADFARFSLALLELDGRKSPRASNATPEFVKYVREEAELASVHGDAVLADTRVNPDGTLDISRWARPQNDGPPLRALAVRRWLRHAALEPGLAADLRKLLDADLAFTERNWREPSFDVWEEELGNHYYNLRVSAAALEDRAEVPEILRILDRFWDERAGHLQPLDIDLILAAIHVQGEGAHTVHDVRLQKTLAALEAAFHQAYPINRGRAAPALGRYIGDVYFDGGAWYIATLGAAEFCFRAGWRERGDAYLETVRAFTPPGGELSEQFDPVTGAQKSAKHLAWSYAAFISCVAARTGPRRQI